MIFKNNKSSIQLNLVIKIYLFMKILIKLNCFNLINR